MGGAFFFVARATRIGSPWGSTLLLYHIYHTILACIAIKKSERGVYIPGDFEGSHAVQERSKRKKEEKNKNEGVLGPPCLIICKCVPHPRTQSTPDVTPGMSRRLLKTGCTGITHIVNLLSPFTMLSRSGPYLFKRHHWFFNLHFIPSVALCISTKPFTKLMIMMTKRLKSIFFFSFSQKKIGKQAKLTYDAVGIHKTLSKTQGCLYTTPIVLRYQMAKSWVPF